ncbi:membrane protein [Fulvitalea axinellae]|uniref:Membrane protein n=1 Tax=Fulvitalea axinellae TaxID=1182444 RepID=A0AAU9CII0_9BACT|nr:membrane protein [Fulvitalea axinellae]
MTEKGFRPTFRRELRRIASKPAYWLAVAVFPAITAVFYYQLMGAGILRELPIAVHDADNSPLSRQLLRYVEASPTLRITERYQSLEEGKAGLLEGKVYALLYLPQDFEKGFYRGSGSEAELFHSYISMAAGGNVSKAVTMVASTFSAGVEIQTRMKKGSSQAKAMNDFMPIRLISHSLSNPDVNYFYFLGGALIWVAMMSFVTITSIYAMGSEIRFRSARQWMGTAGGSIYKALAGKLLPYTIAYGITAVGIHYLLFRMAGFPLNGDERALYLAYFLFILACQGLAVAFVSLQPVLRKALTSGLLFCGFAFTCAGVTFPSSELPGGFRALSQIIPFTHFVEAFFGQSMRGIPLAYQTGTYLSLAAFLCLFAMAPLLRKRLISPKRKRLL